MALPELDDLIAAVHDRADAPDVLSQLQAAADTSEDLLRLSDLLLDHFVQQARTDGRSWTQIGTVLGVSKQAAQQRHGSPEGLARRLRRHLPGRGRDRGFFHRFTAESRSVVMAAQEAAHTLGHDHVGTEHLLLALLQVEGTAAERALTEGGITLDDVRHRVVTAVPGTGQPSTGHLPFTPRAKKVLELALRESISLRHRDVGPEHILLGLLREGQGLAAQVLTDVGADTPALREAAVQLREQTG